MSARTIWKFPLRLETLPDHPQPIDIPIGASLVHVQSQDDRPCMWFELNPVAEAEVRTFGIIPTGGDAPAGGTYRGTVHIGWTVWHVYEATS